MSTRIKVNMKPVNTILTRLGIDKNGDVQRHVTQNVSNRLYKYIPRRGGVLEKSKYITSNTTIEVIQPYATYQYYGELMVDPVTRSSWAKSEHGPKVRTGIPLKYNTSEKALAGPKWDQRMMAAEGAQIAKELQTYVDRKAGKR